MRAAQSELVDVNDELDHLGLYLRENNYSMYASNLTQSKPTHLSFDGYRKPIDEYYSAVFRGEPATLPRQEMPARLAEIITFLGASSLRGRSGIVSFLLDSSGTFRKTIANAIDQQLLDNATLRRAKPLSTYGNQAFTLFTWSPAVPRDALFAREHEGCVGSSGGDEPSAPGAGVLRARSSRWRSLAPSDSGCSPRRGNRPRSGEGDGIARSTCCCRSSPRQDRT